MIRHCDGSDFEVIYQIINDAASAYRNVIPANCWHEPYMPADELKLEIAAGIHFTGYEEDSKLVGVMGVQYVQDVTLIRHAYVQTARRNHGIGGKLLSHLVAQTTTPLLIGTWADAEWAVRFYQNRGFQLVPQEEKDGLLARYWSVPQRQMKTSVVLADPKWFEFSRVGQQ